MTRSGIDANFARFRQTGSPEALAAVFDAVAPRLLLVAMHLCRDANVAEDLLQTVFLQAIRDAKCYDPEQPVLPWLLAILEHRASDRRGRAYVRRELGNAALEAAAGTAVDAAPGPERAAVDAELRSQITAALDGVPRDYREILTLRLVHGLRAIDIAHSQGVSPATIRTRLRRGLGMLRASLPRGIATALLLAVLTGEWLRARDGLPAIRQRLLRSLPTAPVTAVASAVAAKWLWASGIAAALALAMFSMLQTREPAPPTASTAGGALPAAAEFARRDERPAAPAKDRERIANQRLPVLPAATGTTTVLRGRVVSLHGGAPMPFADVQLRTWPASGRGEVPADWRDPPPVAAEADGSFAFSFVPPVALSYVVKATAKGFVPADRSYESLRQGIEVDVGDLELEAGTPTRLRVLVADQPVSDVEVYAERAAGTGGPGGARWRGKTDENGEVDLRICGAGTWHYEVSLYLRGPTTGSFEVPLQAAVFTHTIELLRPIPELSVSGTVVDQYGQPIAGLELRLPIPGAWGNGYLPVTTQRDGTFLFSRNKPWEGIDEWQLQLPPERTDLAWIDAGGKFAWGSNDLQLVVRRRAPATLRLEVVDAATGAAVASFGARCIPDPWRDIGGSPNFEPVATESHPGGRCVFDGLRPAPYRVTVEPSAPYAAQPDLSIELHEGQDVTLRVELAPPAVLEVEVVAAGTGEAMAGVVVSLARVVPAEKLADLSLEGYARLLLMMRDEASYSTGTNVRCIDNASTNADGRTRLHAAADTPGLTVYVEAPHCSATLVRAVHLPPAGGKLRIEVEPAGQLRGRLGPAKFLQGYGPEPAELAAAAASERIELPDPERFADAYPEIQLRRNGASEAAFATYVDPEGAFAFASLPAGRYEVWARARMRGPRSSYSCRFGPLASVDIVAGTAATEIALDLAHEVPGRAAGRFFVDGQPWSGSVGFAHLNDGAANTNSATMGDDGIARSLWLLPGRYVPYATIDRDDGEPRHIFGLEPFTVEADASVEVVAVLQRRAVVVTVRDPQGRPVAGRRVVPEAIDDPQFGWQWRAGAQTDEQGQVVFDPAPPGRLRLRAFALDQGPHRDGVEPELLLGELASSDNELSVRLPQ